MFTLREAANHRNSRTLGRREFLQVGSLAMAGLTLPGLLAAKAKAAASGSALKERSVVLLFLQGGPSQIETFDPKMSAPENIRSTTGELATKLPGVTFGGTFPKLAQLADRLAVVRSFASGNADHQNYLSVAGGGNPLQVPMGTLYSRVSGTNHPRTGMPTNIAVLPEAVQAGLKLGSNFETQSLQTFLAAGQRLGASFAAFDPSGGGQLRKNLELRISRERFDDRHGLIAQLDGFNRGLDATKELETASVFEKQAYDLLVRGISGAFDLSKEDPHTLERYDTSKLFPLETVTKWYDMKRASNLLGKQMLLARRLCEAGCGFVTVFDAGWDMHANGNSPKKMAGLEQLGRQVDHAVAAFVEDVRARGLEDKILLVVTGEMGRTPRINKGGGRDHWANLTPLLFAGGGLKMGQVIGKSDRQAGVPATEKYTPKHLFATVMNSLFDINEVRVNRDVPKGVADAITDGTAIRELF